MDGAIIKTPLSDEPRYVPSILDTQYWGDLHQKHPQAQDFGVCEFWRNNPDK